MSISIDAWVPKMNEYNEAVITANLLLDQPYADPDGNACLVARQFLRTAGVMNALAQQLSLAQCSCTRQYPYSGKGVTMCGRCRALVFYEMHTMGQSETQKTFEWNKP